VKRPPALRGLNENHNHELKALFKSTATRASTAAGPFGEFYAALLATGMRPTMARLTVARKIAAIVLRSASTRRENFSLDIPFYRTTCST
jgi:hypothetical protein